MLLVLVYVASAVFMGTSTHSWAAPCLWEPTDSLTEGSLAQGSDFGGRQACSQAETQLFSA